MTSTDPDAALCYVGRQPCGCVGYLAVKPDDSPSHAQRRRRVGRELLQLLRDGWRVETLTVGEARRLPFGTRCNGQHGQEA